MGGSDPNVEQEPEQVVEGTAVKTPEQAAPSGHEDETDRDKGGDDLAPGEVGGQPNRDL